MFGTVEHSGSLDLVVVCGCHGKGNPSGSVEVLAHLGCVDQAYRKWWVFGGLGCGDHVSDDALTSMKEATRATHYMSEEEHLGEY